MSVHVIVHGLSAGTEDPIGPLGRRGFMQGRPTSVELPVEQRDHQDVRHPDSDARTEQVQAVSDLRPPDQLEHQHPQNDGIAHAGDGHEEEGDPALDPPMWCFAAAFPPSLSAPEQSLPWDKGP
jgi:hypothetical protein